MRLTKTFLSITFLAGVLTTPAAFADPASTQYVVTVDTTSAAASYGYIDFQFNPSSFTTQPANADVANFTSDGILNPADPNNGTSGAVSGMLPGTVTLMNSQPSPNEYTEGMTFETTLSFDLDFYGPALSNPNGDGGGSFYLDFFDSNGNYLFTNNANGYALEIDINPNGTTTASYVSPDVQLGGPTFVPEPSSILLLLGGVAGLAFFGRRRIFSSAKV